MDSLGNLSSVPSITSASPAFSRSNHPPYSARTPGEGYPFPRSTRLYSGLQTKAFSSDLGDSHPQITTITSKGDKVTCRTQVINMEVFTQLLAMEDEEEDRKYGFTKGLIDLYFEDAEKTVSHMKTALETMDYRQLAGLAHFLRGSAASVGIIEVARVCESMEMAILSNKTSDGLWFKSQILSIDQAHLSARQWFHEFYTNQESS